MKIYELVILLFVKKKTYYYLLGVVQKPGGGGTAYDGPIGEAPPEWGIFFRGFRVTDTKEKLSLLSFNVAAKTFVLIDNIAKCLYLSHIF